VPPLHAVSKAMTNTLTKINNTIRCDFIAASSIA
jgi:hypothetical protein